MRLALIVFVMLFPFGSSAAAGEGHLAEKAMKVAAPEFLSTFVVAIMDQNRKLVVVHTTKCRLGTIEETYVVTETVALAEVVDGREVFTTLA